MSAMEDRILELTGIKPQGKKKRQTYLLEIRTFFDDPEKMTDDLFKQLCEEIPQLDGWWAEVLASNKRGEAVPEFPDVVVEAEAKTAKKEAEEPTVAEDKPEAAEPAVNYEEDMSTSTRKATKGGKSSTRKPSTKARSTTARKGTKSEIDRAAKITLLAKDNPKRKNSGAAKRFGYYKTGMTVEQFLEKGGTLGDVKWDRDHEFIKLSG